MRLPATYLERDMSMLSFEECIRRGVRDAKREMLRRRRRRRAAAASVVVALLAVCAGAGVWMLGDASKVRELQECEESVKSLSDSYSQASELHAKLREIFIRGDEGYDLNALSAAYDSEPPGIPAVDCSTNPSLDGVDVDSLSGALRDYISQTKGLLGMG